MAKTPKAASLLMLWGAVGVVIGLVLSLGAVWIITGELPLPFLLVIVFVGVPGTLWYLWTHRAPDNTRFIPK